MKPVFKDDAWYAQVNEEIIDPERPIIDPHHHLLSMEDLSYLLDDLWKDTGAGHNIEKTVFIECGTHYRTSGADHLRPVGETEFVAEVASRSAQGGAAKAKIAGIVSHADLTLGERLDEVLDAHEEAGSGLFRGIRHAAAHHPRPEEAVIPGPAPARLLIDDSFQAGVRRLGQRGLSFDSWHYHFQLGEFIELAKAAPDTILILDHFGTPLGTQSYRNHREDIFLEWQTDIAALAEYPNVYAKLGGLAMPDNGFGWHEAAKPVTSDELVAAQKHYYMHTIECFGTERCMFESNFPVDKFSVSYPVLWNAFKKMTSGFSESEKQDLFYDTASQVYRLTEAPESS